MKVVVVGAGLAGLVAATDLAEAGADVAVLEARSRVGGRTFGIEVAPGAWVDAGAAYLGERHTALVTLLDELGCKTVPTTVEGHSRFALGDGVQTRAGRFPPLSAVALGTLFDLLDEVTSQVRPDAPWLSPNAAALDELTVAEWLDERLTHPDARLFLPLFLGEMMAADPTAVSVLHMAFYLRSGGGLRYLNAFAGGAQDSRVAGGAHEVCVRLAEGLTGRVHLGEPVHAIVQDETGATVHGRAGPVRADAVVVAVPPLLADTIDYRPGLPGARAGSRTVPGCAVKVHLIYPRPVWREQELSGWSMSADGPLLSTVDDSPPDAAIGVLTGFVTGREAHRFAALPGAQRRAAVLAQAHRLFPGLPEPIRVEVTDWINDPYSRGCYAALMGPGDWRRLGPQLTTPHGRVHWAGTETSTAFFGLMEGAIRSGHRAAAEIVGRPR
jgi:monoamine oxidase